MKPVAIAVVNLRRVLRDKTGLFFIVVFPFLIIIAIGAAFGSGFTPTLGVTSADGHLAEDLLARLTAIESVQIRSYADADALISAVERGQAAAGVVVPADYDAAVAAGDTAGIGFVARPTGVGQQLRALVASAVDEQILFLRAGAVASAVTGAGAEEAMSRAEALAAQASAVEVDVSAAADDEDGPALGQFDAGAAQQLILFIFVTSLSASATLVESRRLGVSQRMLSTPTSLRSVLLGETLGRFGIALFQALLIIAVSGAVLGVRWGDPLGASAIVLLFCAVGTGAGMLMGATLANAQQAGSLGVFLGLGLAALGGSMVPLEVFPAAMRTVAHATPHAWALDGFSELLARGGGVTDIGPELAALASFAAVLLWAAIRGLRSSITR